MNKIKHFSNIEYYILWFYYKHQDKYLIWFSSDYKDGIFIKDNKILIFDSKESLYKFSELNKIFINDSDLVLHNLDILEKIYINNMSLKYHKDILNCWNLFIDISNSLYNKSFFEIAYEKIVFKYKNKKRLKKYIFKIYDKLFFSNNLSVITPKGKFYTPIWSKSEIKLLTRINNVGFKIFIGNIKSLNKEDL